MIDTGSQISSVSCSFRAKSLSHLQIRPLSNLVIRQAGGSVLPYLGYVEAEISVPTQEKPIGAVFLVVPDTEYNLRIPLLIGTNILEYLRKPNDLNSIQEHERPWAFAMSHLQRMSDEASVGGRVKTTQNVKIPAFGKQVVEGLVHNRGQSVCAMTIDTSKFLPQGLVGVPTSVITGSGQTSKVRLLIKNLTAAPIEIKRGKPLCTLQQVELVEDDQRCADNPVMTPDDVSGPHLEMSHENSNISISKDEFFKLFNDLNDLEQRVGVERAEKIFALLWKWRAVFSVNDLDVGRTEILKHRIEMTDTTPFKQRYRRIPPGMIEEVRLHLRQLLDSGVIRPSKSPFASNVVLVRKKDNSLRMCVDFRALNKLTIRDAYDIPRIEESLDAISGAQWFSCFDLKSGYFQLEIAEEHKERTAFSAGPLGFFEFNRMPMGLAGAPASFQRAMEMVAGDLNLKEMLIYLDDIISHAKNFDQHIERLERLFSVLAEHGLKISPKKCQVCHDEVRYLGHLVGKQGIRADP